MYRGQFRSEHVQVWPREISDDGMCGEVSRFPAVSIERYFCTIWREDVEHVRTDQGNAEIVVFGILGDNADIQEGWKIIRADGREYVITKIFNEPGVRRRRAHLQGRMRHYQP